MNISKKSFLQKNFMISFEKTRRSDRNYETARVRGVYAKLNNLFVMYKPIWER